MRPKNFVQTKDIKIHIQRLYINKPMGSISNTIHTNQSAMFVYNFCDFFNRMNSAEDVRYVRYSNKASAFRHKLQQVSDFKPQRLRVDIPELNFDAMAFQVQPGANI